MSANNGSCLCGNVKISFTGEPNAHAVCHCLDCRKISGAPFSNNLIVPNDAFKLESGTPKQFAKKTDAGNTITSYFCGDCGTTVYRQTPAFGPSTIVKAGVLEDQKWADKKPAAEFYIRSRGAWESPIPGVDQQQTM